MEYTISTLVENHAGVLARLAQLFSARGFNIVSLTVAETDDPTMSRMTIVVEGDEKVMEQVKKQLNKSIDVVKVYDLTGKNPLVRELCILKVKATPTHRSEIIEIVDIYHASIIDVSHQDVTIEATGETSKVLGIIKLLKPYGIKEIVRTGKVALARSLNI
ncbi:MAG: acetolactate synthase small subunit [Spirochaetes bacterium]|nr:acetolactate synthase small subunit [Spirochaetota bacterium]